MHALEALSLWVLDTFVKYAVPAMWSLVNITHNWLKKKFVKCLYGVPAIKDLISYVTRVVWQLVVLQIWLWLSLGF